ncbi:MAG: HEPN domain-containing protein [Methanobrevibacter sp.]|nr:HEPN domain-containing protein [Methanobrevibacter sp.]
MSTKTHKGLIRKFGLEYVIKDKFDEKIAKKLSGLEEDRNKVDYEFDFAEKTKAKIDLKDAKEFIEECRKFISENL